MGKDKRILELINEKEIPVKYLTLKGKLWRYKDKQFVSFDGKSYLICQMAVEFKLDTEALWKIMHTQSMNQQLWVITKQE